MSMTGNGYGGPTGAKLNREHLPAHEILTIDDYRARHAQYKSDPSSQAMHAAHPLIPIWDDHETSNDSWKGGAENHNPESEGKWAERKRAALQAYYEWMPVREPSGAPEAFYRTFAYGDLLTLFAIESRLMARSEQLDYDEVVRTITTPEQAAEFKKNVLWSQSREMLGASQLAFLKQAFDESSRKNQPWRLIANQVIMAEVINPDLTPHMTEEDIEALEAEWDQGRAFVQASTLGLPWNFDSWGAYPAARERFYELLKSSGDAGTIVLTGDTHTWWANDLTDKDQGKIGVELGVHSVTSPSPFRKEFLGGKGAEYALLTNKDNKDVRYLSGEDHGYIDLEVTPNDAKARYVAIDNIESAEYNAFEKLSLSIKRTKSAAKFAGVKGLDLKERALFG